MINSFEYTPKVHYTPNPWGVTLWCVKKVRRGKYCTTTDPALVTCKRCRLKLAKLHRQKEEFDRAMGTTGIQG